MSRGTQPFTQGDITRAAKGATRAGLSVRRIEVDKKTGNIIVFTDVEPEPEPETEDAAELI